MSAQKHKKSFDWQDGETLDDKENYSPMGDVRATGMPKLKKAVPADPVTRKKERDAKILAEQSLPLQKIRKPQKEGEIIIEESQSGLSGDFEDSQVRKIIDHGKKLRGVDRFGKKKES